MGQSSMSVFAGTVMQEFQQSTDLLYRFIGVVTSKARLYSFDPEPQLLREWPEIFSPLIEVFVLHLNRRVQTIFIGNGVGFEPAWDGYGVDQMKTSR
jgi:hypothetical protein